VKYAMSMVYAQDIISFSLSSNWCKKRRWNILYI